MVGKCHVMSTCSVVMLLYNCCLLYSCILVGLLGSNSAWSYLSFAVPSQTRPVTEKGVAALCKEFSNIEPSEMMTVVAVRDRGVCQQQCRHQCASGTCFVVVLFVCPVVVSKLNCRFMSGSHPV